MLEIERRAKGLVDMPEDRLRDVSSGIRPEGLDITSRRSDVARDQRADGSSNTPKERMMHRRFKRSTR